MPAFNAGREQEVVPGEIGCLLYANSIVALEDVMTVLLPPF